jgi:hypothetical protein
MCKTLPRNLGAVWHRANRLLENWQDGFAVEMSS